MITLLSKKDPWERIIKNSRSIFNNELKIKIIKNNLNYSRYGIIVSLAVDKRAVVRNRIRRQIKNHLAKINYHIASGYDIIIFVKASIKDISFNQIKNNLNTLLKKNNLLSNFS